ncbi:MAG: lamin tail domain-containing protein [Myxococcales bacterium]|nr:lamin tail domain-containing protein [Myxococcales bacterium]
MSCLAVGTVTAGSLVITEIMNNPAAATHAAGERFELYNPGPNCDELKGLTLTSKSDLPHTVGTSVVVLAGKYAVIGRNADMALNGKIAVDYAFGTALNLGNDADDLVIASMGTVVDLSAWDGVGLDPNGKSRSLNPKFLTAAQNDDDTNFCVATSMIAGSIDFGTPSAANDACP